MPLLLNHTIKGIYQIRFSFRDRVQNYSFKKRSVISVPMRYKVRPPEMPISIVGKHIFRNLNLFFLLTESELQWELQYRGSV